MEMDNSMVYSDSLKNFKEYITKQFGGVNDYDNNVFNYIKNDGSVDLLDLNNPNNLSNFNNNITEANIMRSFILNKTYYNNPNNINVINEFFSRNKPWAIYFAEDFNNKKLYDCSGNGRHATTSGDIIKNTNEKIKYISGDVNCKIDFPNGSIPNNFTIASISKYTSGSNKRILQGKNSNWLHGHWDNNTGVAYYNGWKTANNTVKNNDQWIRMIGTNNNYILNNSTSVRTSSNGNGNDKLTINNSSAITSENSNWALSCVIIWDNELNNNDLLYIDDLLTKYMDGLDLKKNLLINNLNTLVPLNALINNNKISESVCKYIFLLDTLASLYDNITKIQYSNILKDKNVKNNLNKTDIYDIFRKGIIIKTHISINNDVLSYDNDIINNIETNNFYDINYHDVSINRNYINLFNSIKTDLDKHINFVKNNDMFQSYSYYLYYKLCYIILCYNINIYVNINKTINVENSLNNQNDINIDNLISEFNRLCSKDNILNIHSNIPSDVSSDIINKMLLVGDLNTNIKKINANIELKKAEYKYYNNNIVYTNYVEFFAIALLVLIVITSILISILNDKSRIILYNTILLIITIIIFTFSYIYITYNYSLYDCFYSLYNNEYIRSIVWSILIIFIISILLLSNSINNSYITLYNIILPILLFIIYLIYNFIVKNYQYDEGLTNTDIMFLLFQYSFIKGILLSIIIAILISIKYLSSFGNTTKLIMFNIILLIIVLVIYTYLYSYIGEKYYLKENFTVPYNSNYIDYFKDSFKNITIILKDTKIAVTNYIEVKKMVKEHEKYEKIVDKYNVYNKTTNNDINLLIHDNKKKKNDIIFLFVICLLILLFNIIFNYADRLSLILYIILVIIVIGVYCYYQYRYVNTENTKFYWKKPTVNDDDKNN